MNQENIFDDISTEFEVTPLIRTNLLNAAKWGKILSIFLYLFALITLLTFILGAVQSTSSPFRNYVGTPLILYLIIQLTIIILTGFAAMNLWGFSTRVKKAFDTDNKKNLAIALESLGAYFKLFGIYVLAIIFLIVIFYISVFFIMGRGGF